MNLWTNLLIEKEESLDNISDVCPWLGKRTHLLLSTWSGMMSGKFFPGMVFT